MDWDSDRRLQLRMVLALVAVMPLAFVATTSWALNAVVFPLAEELLAVRLSRVGCPAAAGAPGDRPPRVRRVIGRHGCVG